VRDQCLGLSFVRADGQRAKAGGQVVKNVAGYDLMKLFTGSYGSLGVVTDLTLRLYPIPEASQTLFLQGESLPLGRLLSFLRDSTLTPTVLDGMGGELVTQLGGTAPVGLVIRFQSLAESVIAQVQQTREWAADLVVKVLSGEEETQFWRQLRRSLWSSAPTNITVVAKVGGLPNQTVAQLEKAAAIAQAAHLTFSGLIHSGSGVGTIRVSGAELDHLRNGVLALRQHWQQAQGYLSILEAPYGLKQIVEVWGYGGNAMVSDRPVAIAPMQQLKDKFDPYHCLNPGRFVGGM
jgi:glycolate oxidase FAD binding subunit